MRPLRRLVTALEPGAGGGGGGGGGSGGSGVPAGAGAGSAARLLGPVTAADLAAALAVTKPTGAKFAAEYESFAERFGQAA